MDPDSLGSIFDRVTKTGSVFEKRFGKQSQRLFSALKLSKNYKRNKLKENFKEEFFNLRSKVGIYSLKVFSKHFPNFINKMHAPGMSNLEMAREYISFWA